MREGWKEVKIGDLGKVVTGNTPPKNDIDNYGGKHAFIKPTDMDIGRRYVTTWEENYSEKAFKRYRNSYIPPKATGVVTIGTVGEKMFQADQWCFTNQSVNVIIPNAELYDEDFIFYLMKINLPKVENANPGTASGRHHVSKSNFCAIKVRVPESKETQRKIASILSGYDDLIENNLKRIKILEEMAQQTYEEWFVRMRFPGYENAVFDENGLPEGWEKVSLTDFAEITFGYAFKANDFNSDGNGTPIIRIRNIPKSTTNDFTTEIVRDKYVVNNGDILIGMDGEFYINVWTGNKGYLVQRVCKLVSMNYTLQGYLLEALKLPLIHYQNSIDGATLAHLGKKHLDEIEICVPDGIDLSFFQSLMLEKINLQSQNQRLQEVRDILLPRLIMGMIDVDHLTVEKETAEVINLEIQKKEVSKEFKEAVLIAMLTDRFGSEQYPLGRKRYTKLSYLFHRYSDNKIQDYLRKAAGPYNPKTKYGGPEKIALNSKYIQNWKSDNKMTGFVTAEKIEDAKNYFPHYWQVADLDWLTNEFKFKSNDELELLATVDNSLVELANKNMDFNTANVLAIIKSEKEWQAKLERTVFNDANVEKAICFLRGILEYGGQ